MIYTAQFIRIPTLSVTLSVPAYFPFVTLSTRDAAIRVLHLSIYPPITSHYSGLASLSRPTRILTHHHSTHSTHVPRPCSLSFLVRLPHRPSTRHSIGLSGCRTVGPRTGANLPPSEPEYLSLILTNFDRALRWASQLASSKRTLF